MPLASRLVLPLLAAVAALVALLAGLRAIVIVNPIVTIIVSIFMVVMIMTVAVAAGHHRDVAQHLAQFEAVHLLLRDLGAREFFEVHRAIFHGVEEFLVDLKRPLLV